MLKLVLILILKPVSCFAFFQDTPVLLQIASSTSAQVVRLEKLLSNSKSELEFIKKMKESTDIISEYYDTIDETNSALMALNEISGGKIDGLEGVNDSIEDLQDKRDRLDFLMKKAALADSTSKAVAHVTTENTNDIRKEVALNKRQEEKSFGKKAKRNQEQVTAQNTSLINSKLTVTNSLLKKQTLAQAEMNQLIIADIVNREKEKKSQEEYMTLKGKKRL